MSYKNKNANFGVWGDQGDGYYVNPILESDYSDPDVIRVGHKYYLVTSTFQLYPGVAILESTDMVNFKTINYVFDDLTKIDKKLNWDEMDRYNDGNYACSLRYLEYNENVDGKLVKKSKWFLYTTFFTMGIVVATADDIYGKWEYDFMLDKNGEKVIAYGWDDNCPYWQFNQDGTLKNAYMIASKVNHAWYTHIFQMSLDGKTLLDGDIEYLSKAGDFTRVRDNDGDVIHKITGKKIITSKNWLLAHDTQINSENDIESILYATHICGREGTVIRDVYTAEGSKIIKFGKDTDIGNTYFKGRHGDKQMIADYIYIYNNEYWDDQRLPVISRAKSIYGDKFDENGNYIGSGTAGDPGSFESQRMLVDTNVRQPNQGAFVDIPANLAKDGIEHWYFYTHQGCHPDGPQARPTSLLPVTWVEGFPMVGKLDLENIKSMGVADNSAKVYDGTNILGNSNNKIHHPNARIKPGVFMWYDKMPPIKSEPMKSEIQGSDNFSGKELSKYWQWNYQPRKDYWKVGNGKLRLYAFNTINRDDNFFKIGNVICQKYMNSDNVVAKVSLDISNLKNGQHCGIAHFNGGKSYATLDIYKDELGVVKILNQILENQNKIILRSTVNRDRLNLFEYSLDNGKTFIEYDNSYTLVSGGSKGDLIGIYTYNDNADYNGVPGDDYPYGYIEVENFIYEF